MVYAGEREGLFGSRAAPSVLAVLYLVGRADRLSSYGVAGIRLFAPLFMKRPSPATRPPLHTTDGVAKV